MGNGNEGAVRGGYIMCVSEHNHKEGADLSEDGSDEGGEEGPRVDTGHQYVIN